MDFEVNDLSKIKDEFPNKRDCLSEITDYLFDDKTHRICAIYGLRRTGKTVLMQQAFLSLSEECRKQSVFITCNRDSDFYNILKYIKNSIDDGKKYFFIDEITYADKFQKLAEILSDNYVSLHNARIVVTGTDSLGLSLPTHSNLYDRSILVHTTYMPFAEFARITGNKSIDYYMKHGSTLSDISPFESDDFGREYLETSIVENFIKSLEKSEGLRSYPPVLTELYDNDELENAVQRIINSYSQTITIKALRKNFELSPLENGINAIQKSRENPDVLFYQNLNSEQITENVRKLLKIDIFKTKISENHLDVIKKLLKEMDVITCIPVATSYSGKSLDKDMEMITHPGMFYANLLYTINQLKEDSNWLPDTTAEQKNRLLNSVYETSAGKIQENIIIADVYKMLVTRQNELVTFEHIPQNRWYVSKFSYDIKGMREEADLIVFDRKNNETYLFEIKHTKNVSEGQTRLLDSKVFIDYIKKNFGCVKHSVVLYNGKNDISLTIPCLNIACFLSDIYSHSKSKSYSLDDTIKRLVKRAEKDINRSKN